jgi:arylsulfatase A
MRFTNFYAAAPVCSPTRAAILSGKYPARLGLTAHIPGHWRPFEKLVEPPIAQHLPLEIVTIAETLKASGYVTGHFGKWHLGGNGFGPKEQGFDVAIEWQQHVIPGPRQEPPGDQPKRAVEYLTDKTIAFIEANRDRPFYVQLQPFAVHIPLNTTPELQAKYEKKPKVDGYTCQPLYAGVLEELDSGVGRVLDALDKFRLSDNTIVVFTSDNGGLEREVGGWPGTLNRPLRDEKGTLYEGGIRIPTIIRWPGVTPSGGVQDAAAISTDFYPTFVEASGARYATEMNWDGVSLAPTCREPGVKSSRAALYWHYPHYHHSRPSGAVRAGEWKLIEFFDTATLELYNLKDDLSEAHDLATAQPERVRELHGLLKKWRQEVGAQMPQANPAHDPKRAGEWWNRATLKPTEAPGTYRPN